MGEAGLAARTYTLSHHSQPPETIMNPRMGEPRLAARTHTLSHHSQPPESDHELRHGRSPVWRADPRHSYEVLRGSPYTVVGTTDQVAGQIAFDPSNPSTAQLGTILIDARTLVTDDESRTRALGNRILSTDQYEYISFAPTALVNLPSSVTVGQAFTFQATGDLTSKDVTRPATFGITVTPADDGSLTGTATSTIQYADWGVGIPSVPFVASVADSVILQLDFGASATA
jgi:polyisoprenoid-binding protein YceI